MKVKIARKVRIARKLGRSGILGRMRIARMVKSRLNGLGWSGRRLLCIVRVFKKV